MKKNLKEHNQSVAKASIGYTIGNYFIKGIGFITTPIFARLMTTSDFGIYNTFIAYESIIYIFIGLTLHASLKNAKYKFEKQFDEYTSSIIILPVIMFIALSFIATILKNELSTFLGFKSSVIFIMLLYSYCSGLMIFYQNRIALDYNYIEYLKLSFFNVVCNITISVILILTIFSYERYMGRILGGTVAYFCLACYVWYNLIRRSRPIINIEYWKYALHISIPLIPHGLAQILLLQFDRIMISKMVGSVEAGLYSFAYTIFSLVQITCASLETVFSPWVYKQLHQENNINNVKRIGTCFMILLAGVVTTIMLVCPELIMLLGGKKYKESIYCALPVLFAGFFAMAYCIPAVLEYYKEKTNYIAIGTVIASILNVVLNYMFISRYGYIAAAYTTLISYVVYFIIHVFISRKLGGFYIIKTIYLLASIIIVVFAFIVSSIFINYIVIRMIVLFFLYVIGIIMMINVYGRNELKIVLLKIKKK